jgi:hypothetical protein
MKAGEEAHWHCRRGWGRRARPLALVAVWAMAAALGRRNEVSTCAAVAGRPTRQRSSSPEWG